MNFQVNKFHQNILSISILLFIYFSNPFGVYASTSSNQMSHNNVVIEHLRLKVPSSTRSAWLKVERETWQPWLAKQPGFLRRELLWDQNNEEATLLISWSSREKWKSIPQEQIDFVQDEFESFARKETGQLSGNPFPLIHEGELIPQ